MIAMLAIQNCYKLIHYAVIYTLGVTATTLLFGIIICVSLVYGQQVKETHLIEESQTAGPSRPHRCYTVSLHEDYQSKNTSSYPVSST